LNIGASQPTDGLTGLLNTPSATMQKDRSFLIGGNFLPEPLTPSCFNYHTYNYFLNLTFLPFLEINYRMTLFKNRNKYNRQDRAFAIRLQVLKEKRYFPAFLLGASDIFTSSHSGNQYFSTMYSVLTKHIDIYNNNIAFTLGYGYKYFLNSKYQGIFSGVSIIPSFYKKIKIITEYDTANLNIGLKILLLNHINLMFFSSNLSTIAGGISFQAEL